jgi:hypothetical protein
MEGERMMERWERRARKLRKRRDAMQVSGAGLKKVHLPMLDRRSEEAQKRAANKKGRPLSPFLGPGTSLAHTLRLAGTGRGMG